MLLRLERPFASEENEEEEASPTKFAIRVDNNELFATVAVSRTKVKPGDALTCDVEFRGQSLQLAVLLVQDDSNTVDSALIFTKDCVRTQVILHVPQLDDRHRFALNFEFVCGPRQNDVRRCSVPLFQL